MMNSPMAMGMPAAASTGGSPISSLQSLMGSNDFLKMLMGGGLIGGQMGSGIAGGGLGDSALTDMLRKLLGNNMLGMGEDLEDGDEA